MISTSGIKPKTKKLYYLLKNIFISQRLFKLNEAKFIYHDAGIGDFLINKNTFTLLKKINPNIKLITNKEVKKFIEENNFNFDAELYDNKLHQDSTVLNLTPYKKYFRRKVIYTNTIAKQILYRSIGNVFLKPLGVSIYNEYVLSRKLKEFIVVKNLSKYLKFFNKVAIFPDSSCVKRSLSPENLYKIVKKIKSELTIFTNRSDICAINFNEFKNINFSGYKTLSEYVAHDFDLIISSDSWVQHHKSFFEKDVLVFTLNNDYFNFLSNENIYLPLRKI